MTQRDDLTPPKLPNFEAGKYGATPRLSPSQEMAFLMNSVEPRSSFCILSLDMTVKGPLDVELMGTSIRAVVARQDSLRTIFEMVDGRPVPVIVDAIELAIPMDDLSDLEPHDQAQALSELRRAEGCRPFDLERGPLMRVRMVHLGPDHHELMFCFHHTVADGYSAGVMMVECHTLYTSAQAGREPSLLDPPKYSDYAAWQHSWLTQPDIRDALRAHWRGQMKGLRAIELPTDHERRAFRDASAGTVVQVLSADTFERLLGLRKTERLSPFDTLFAAFNLLLGRLAGTEDVGVTVPFANRTQPQHLNMVGFVANPLLLRTDLSGDPDFRTLIKRTKAVKKTAKKWQALPFVQLRELLDEDVGDDPLSRVWFDLLDTSSGALSFPGLETEWAQLPGSFAAGLDLMLSIIVHSDSVELHWIYAESLYERGTIARMAESLAAIVGAMLANLDGRAEDITWPGAAALDAGVGEREVERLRAALLTIDTVADCHVIERAVHEPAPHEVSHEWCAYVSVSRSLDVERLAKLTATLREQLSRPVMFTLVDRLPRSADGSVDEAALRALPVVDSDLVSRWTEALQRVEGVEKLAVRRHPDLPRPPALHLDLVAPPIVSAIDPTAAAAWQHGFFASDESGEVRLALADGGPLEIPRGAPATLTEAFLRVAKAGDGRGLIHIGLDGSEHRQSYAELLEAARRVWTGLAKLGMRPGQRAVLQIADAREYYPVFWGCVLGGITPVTVAIPSAYALDNAVTAKLLNTWALLESPPVLASGALCGPLRDLDDPRGKLQVLSIDSLRDNAPSEPIYEAKPDDRMFFQLTSGSTGVPKCIQETHGGIVRHIHGSAQVCDYRREDVCLNWLARDHVVPILTFHLKGVYLGCDQVEVPIQTVLADPLAWLDHLDTYKITHTWAPNFGFKMVANAVAENPERSWDLSAMKYFMNAGEQVTRPVVSEFLSALQPFGVATNTMQPAFGMAEVCTCMTYENGFEVDRSAPYVRKSSLSGRLEQTSPEDPEGISFVLLGRPMPGVAIRITDRDNQVLAEDVIGRLQIKGGVVTPGYLSNPEANREAFVGDGWFNTGDLGFIRGGHLAITGREKEMIILNGANHYCYELEDIVDRIDGVEPSFVAACGVADARTGTEELAIFYTPTGPADVVDTQLLLTIQQTVAQSAGVRPERVLPLPRARFPKTTSGKIQRSALKKRLLQGEFDETQRAIDVALENGRTVPDWFFEQAWTPQALAGTPTTLEGRRYLVYADPTGLAARLREWLRESGAEVFLVRRGSKFEQAATGEFSVDPLDAGHHRRVWQSLQALSGPIDEVVHLWPCDAATTDVYDASTQLLLAVQAMGQEREDNHPICWRSVTRRGYVTDAKDSPVLAHATLPSLLGALARENPWLAASVIDLAEEAEGINLAALQKELGLSTRSAQLQESAWRGGERLAPALRRTTPDIADGPADPRTAVEADALYVISGGRGELALALASQLLARQPIKLLLFGRTSAEDSEVQAALARLRREGAEVMYRSADVADETAVRAAAKEAETHWSTTVAGVFHLAGVFHQRALLDQRADGLRASLRAKIGGARALAGLLRGRPGGLFVSFSSVNALFPGATVGAYAAANAFLDRFTHHLREQGVRSHNLSWSLWRGQGMSRAASELEELAGYSGYRLLSREQGLASFEVALAMGRAHVLIGLDPSSPAIRAQLLTEPRPSERLSAHIQTGGSALTPDALPAIELLDRYGTPCPCAVAVGKELPAELSGGGGSDDSTPPRTESEIKVTGIWCEVLGLESVDIHADVFELGGTSLAAAEIFGRLQDLAGREISMAELFHTRTIYQIAQALDAE